MEREQLWRELAESADAVREAIEDAIDRLEAATATLAGRPPMDEADRVLLTRLTDDMTTAQRAVDAVETDLAGALDRARAHDEKGGA